MQVILIMLLAAATLSKMIIQSPPALIDYFNSKYANGYIPYSIANYGVVPYGKTVSGQIGIPSVLQDCVYEQLPDSSQRKNILLVQRNDCTFTQKSINVQKEGGKMAIVIDSVVQEPGNVIMVDDGKGLGVKIPTVLIGKEDGIKLLEFVEGDGVVISVSFQVPVRSESELQLWIDISDRKNFVFLRSLQPYFEMISSHVNLDVAYSTSRCYSTCSTWNCYYGGKYCKNPKGSVMVQNAGKELINEQLRQYFILKTYPNKWWNYVLQYDDNCDNLAILEECSIKIMKKLNIDYSAITRQVQQSFGQTDNEELSALSELKYNSSIMYFPSVVINNFVYRGTLEPHQVFQAICESLSPQPAGCQGFLAQQSSNLSSWIIFSVISVILFCICLVVCYRRIARRQLASTINNQVNELVSQYITMYENDRFNEGVEMKKTKDTIAAK